MDLCVGRGPRCGLEADLARRDEELAVDVRPLADTARGEGELLAASPPGGEARGPAFLVQKPPEVQVSHEVGARVGEPAVGGARRTASLGRRPARVPGAQGGRDHQDLGHAADLSGGQDHPPDPRVHGQAGEPPSDPGHPILGVERPELAKQAVAVRHEAAVRRVDEREFVDPPEPARRHAQDHGREVRAPDLGGGEPRPALEVLPRVEPDARARPDPPAPPAPLLGGGARDRLDGEALDLGPVAVPADAGEPGVDHEPDAGHGNGGLRDVRRQHHPPPLAGAEDPLLPGVVEACVQGRHLEPAVRAKGLRRLPDVALAGQEDEDVARPLPRRRPDRLRHGRDRILGSGPRLRVADLDRVRPSRYVDDRSASEEARDALGVEGCRADDHPEVGAMGEHPLQMAEQQIDVEGALVRLVDDEGVVGLEESVLPDLGHEDPVRHHLDVGVGTDFVVEADLGPDGLPHPAAQLARDAGGHASRGDPPRLGVADPARGPPPRGEADLRELGRLAGARLAADDHDRVAFDGGRDRQASGGDRKLGREVGSRKPGGAVRSGGAGGARAGDGGFESAERGPVAAAQPREPPAEGALVPEQGFADPTLEVGPTRRCDRALLAHGRRRAGG